MDTLHATSPTVPSASSTSVQPSRPARWERAGARTAAAWAVLFAVVNVWVQVAAIGPAHPLSDHLVGLALLNGSVIVLKLVGAGLALGSVRAAGRGGGLVVAGLWAAVTTLAGWGLAGTVALVTSGASPFAPMSMAGGAVVVPGLLYPAFFLAGAVAFLGPARHATRVHRAPRAPAWLGGLVGPVVVLGTIVLISQVLASTGLLPPL